MKKLLISCLGLIVLATCSRVLLAADTEKALQIPMQAHNNYFRERCFVFQGNQTLRVELSSPVKIDFNIHYHTDTNTEYPIRVKQVTTLTETIPIPVDHEYCFMWQNTQQQTSSYVIDMNYQLLAE